MTSQNDAYWDRIYFSVPNLFGQTIYQFDIQIGITFFNYCIFLFGFQNFVAWVVMDYLHEISSFI